ncbi:NmrA family [Seminavis robusta]|uniref:NmrA family n=1 Tax=Seminavis robusta TaxID=568900 RepID=A0A9N8HC46_9STRA|nr:NmrA family [Seminavis robusta]|eukprot:Sro391_g133180.1 NmrA family (246) ;mRNA; r:56834-57571
MAAPSKSTEAVAWDMQPGQGEVQEQWPIGLPKPPSMKKLEVDEMEDTTIPMCVVFNANTVEGATMVRVLSEKGLRVVAVVRVFTGKKTKELIKLKRVVVKVADWNDRESLVKAAEGCERAFLVTRYWERFDSRIEEQMSMAIVQATADAGVKHFVMATFEDTLELKARGLKSQLMPDRKGRIFPKFEGMSDIDEKAKDLGISLSHMMTSYLDLEGAKKSLILIRGPNGKVIVQPYFKDPLAQSTE